MEEIKLMLLRINGRVYIIIVTDISNFIPLIIDSFSVLLYSKACENSITT